MNLKSPFWERKKNLECSVWVQNMNCKFKYINCPSVQEQFFLQLFLFMFMYVCVCNMCRGDWGYVCVCLGMVKGSWRRQAANVLLCGHRDTSAVSLSLSSPQSLIVTLVLPLAANKGKHHNTKCYRRSLGATRSAAATSLWARDSH